jgi:hypothetical protein
MTTTANTWSRADLNLFGGAGEVEVSSVRRDGSQSRERIVWIVRVGDQLYLRSVNGPDAVWYRSTRSRHQGRLNARGLARDVSWVDAHADPDIEPEIDAAIDAEYARKYRGSTSAIERLNSPAARSTTMRVDPR